MLFACLIDDGGSCFARFARNFLYSCRVLRKALPRFRVKLYFDVAAIGAGVDERTSPGRLKTPTQVPRQWTMDPR